MFKIIKKGTMPGGSQIQVEDWGNHLTIAAYPHAVRAYGSFREGETFRLELIYAPSEERVTVMNDYNDLICGNKSLEDMAKRCTDRDHWMLGMAVGERPPVKEQSMSAIMEKAKRLMPIEEQDAFLEKLWADLENIPMDPDSETIEEDFLCFPHGTPREELWHWFDERYSKGIAHLLYRDGIDRTDQTAKTVYLKQLCFECETHGCVYNHDGECRYALVHEQKPDITEEDGCKSGEIPL